MSILVVAALAAVPSGAADRPSPPHPGADTPAAGAAWTTVYHGYAFLTSNRQGGASGEQDFESVNHFMIVSSKKWGPGTLELLGTFSAEPMTIAPAGSPLLFQRGETYRDTLLIDRQHPHDLFVQLAARFSRDFAPGRGVQLYVAPRGAPAVGPTPFVHRLSASENPLAPLAHHNQDSTHIAASVLTAGGSLGRLGLEASAFHGREPDENRWDIDLGGLDSYSGRLSFRPASGLAVQVSAARLHDPEAVEEGDQTRQTASIEYERPTGRGFVAAALVAGRNLGEDGAQERGNTLEATWTFGGGNALYARAERVDRDLYELLNKEQRPGTIPARRVAVGALTIGYVRDLPPLRAATTGLGAAWTAYRFDDRLAAAYGERPASAQVFLRLRFGSKGTGHMHHAALHPFAPGLGEADRGGATVPGR
ncbi:MAG: hypothetical protein HYS34_10630 [Acidobacteria bacterium]|nr:hypothetical protein [Acidobacteriota bacterium]